MSSKAVITQRHKEMEGKQKNVQAEGRNRRALGDIGNLVKAVDAGKPKNQIKTNRPMTRRLCAQLVAKGLPVLGGKDAKEIQVIDDGVVGRKGAAVLEAAAVQKKDCQKPTVILSCDDEDRPKNSGKQSRPGSLNKKERAFTSILSARSKVACGLINKPQNEIIENIDASDVDDELAAVEYVDDIYKYYKLTEGDGQVHDYMPLQTDINSVMRSILIDWLVEVHRKFELMPESLYLTINIVDRYLSMKIVPRRELQLVGVSSMLIACKYEEIWAPEVNDFIAISDNAYTREQSSVPSDLEMENMVFFLAELGLTHYTTVVTYCPSVIAASAVYAARCTLKKSPSWTDTLKHYTGYSEDQLRDCAKLLVSYHAALSESKLKAVYRKFSRPETGVVALVPPVKVIELP
ncbi:Cyclin N-terminal domain-containing protein [Heracleum sosnowskyi]|uniref:Cyclin N-terminal domain-containing protein n=1 Tax=Heracleum sosnowskyi TaxID=360622 RepID=A0AAD8JFK4_9APIA|nr:Cyclin N-terminal domain-containing protein [Heracleum sosnowskyi]